MKTDIRSLSRLLSLFTGLVGVGNFLFGVYDLVPMLVILSLVLVSTYSLTRKGFERLAASANLAITTLGITVLAIEIIVRLFAGTLLYYRPHEILFMHWPAYPEAFRYQENASIRMTVYGDLAALIGDPQYRVLRDEIFETDAYGFRNTPDVANESHQLILLGDSFTAGSDNTQAEIWPELLRSEYGLDVYNMGIPGGPWNSYLNFVLEIDRLNLQPGAEVVFVLFPGNDLDERYGSLPRPETIEKSSAIVASAIRIENFRSRSLFHRLFDRLSKASAADEIVTIRETANGDAVLFYNQYMERARRTPEQIQGLPGFQNLVAVLTAMNSITLERGATFKVVIMPSKEEVYSWLLSGEELPGPIDPGQTAITQALTNVFESLDIPYLDLLADLSQAARTRYSTDGELIWWTDDSHNNLAGHQIIANSINNFLLSTK